METVAVDRKQTAFRLRKDLLERLKIEARKENRSLNNLGVENHKAVQERFEEVSEQGRQDSQSFCCPEYAGGNRHCEQRT